MEVAERPDVVDFHPAGALAELASIRQEPTDQLFVRIDRSGQTVSQFRRLLPIKGNPLPQFHGFIVALDRPAGRLLLRPAAALEQPPRSLHRVGNVEQPADER